MKSTEKLTHNEVMQGLTMCFRELIQTEVSHRNMPNIINRGKAVAQLVTAAHREEVMEMKRSHAAIQLNGAEAKTIKKLKPKN